MSFSAANGAQNAFTPLSAAFAIGAELEPRDRSLNGLGGNVDELLGLAVQQSYSALVAFAQRQDFEQQMQVAFGAAYDREQAGQFFATLDKVGLEALPRLEVLEDEILQGALGVYAKDVDTVYVSRDFVESASIDQLTGVLLEEFGHGIDARINQSDAAGDEGDIFSRLVLGKGIAEGELRSIKAEDDSSQITVNGKLLAVEQAQQDFDGDGKADLFWRNEKTGANKIAFSYGTNAETETNILALSDTQWKVAGTGDFDGDGKSDILWRHYGRGENQIWFMNGSVRKAEQKLMSIGDVNWAIAGTNDFNGDNKTDIVWRNEQTGQNLVWYMNGAVPQKAENLQAVTGKGWAIAATADFNNDNQTDILWRHQESDQNVLWLMNGKECTETKLLPQLGKSTLRIEGTSDFNQDGQMDLLVRDDSTGQQTTWLMNGGSTEVSSKITIGTAAGQGWSSLMQSHNIKAGNSDTVQIKNGFQIEIDYSFDTKGWFTAERKKTLEDAAKIWSSIIQDEFENTPVGYKIWVQNPETGIAQDVIVDRPIDDIRIYVGARQLGDSVLGRGGAAGYQETRYTGNDFEPRSGMVVFDEDSNWFFESNWKTNNVVPVGKSDFLSVALHEIAHALGFSQGTDAFERLTQNGYFIGENAKRENNGQSVALSGDLSHIEPSGGAVIGVVEELMDPSTMSGTRSLPSRLDAAILDDIGYEIDYNAISALINPIQPKITITSPNGGNQLTAGSTYSITWADNLGENVSIGLYKGATKVQTLFTSTASDGSESWIVPSNLVAGNDYKLRISNVNNSQIFDESDSFFSITASPKPDLVVQNPSALSSVTVGDSITIGASTQNIGNTIAGTSTIRYWLSNDTLLSSDDISLGSDPVGGLGINGSEADTHTFTYSESWGTGMKYLLFEADGFKSVLESNENNNVTARSITIQPKPYVRITSPNGGNQLTAGSTYSITWADNISENVSIDLYKGSTKVQTLFTSTASDGSESWTVPSNLVAGNDYKLRVSSINNSQLFDESDSFFSITPNIYPPAFVQLEVTDAYASESSLNPGEFKFTRTGNLNSYITVKYGPVDGDAQNGTDYSFLNGTITFLPGETTKILKVFPIDDSILESEELISIALESGTGYNIDETKKGGTVLLIDNDSSYTPWTAVDSGLKSSQGRGAAWIDYDGDGDLDLFLPNYNSSDSSESSKLYRNDGGKFTDTNSAIVAMFSGESDWGDYDNDGDLDLVLTRSGTTKLYRNDSGYLFDTYMSLGSSWAGDVAWGDYDNDGDLDLAIIGESSISQISGKWVYSASLYNNNKGTFTKVDAQLGQASFGSINWGDYDNDRDLDLLISGFDSESEQYIAKVFRNDNGRFTNINANLVPVYGESAWGDYDGDGNLDILLTGRTDNTWSQLDQKTLVYKNNGLGSFSKRIDNPSYSDGNGGWGDVNNDGLLDVLLSGSSGGTSNASVQQGTSSGFTSSSFYSRLFGQEAIWGDYDNDGDLDVLVTGTIGDYQAGTDAQVSLLYRNNISQGNSKPSTPSNPSSFVVGTTVDLSWGKAADTVTPVNGLTYNLRIGTTPGGSEIMSAMSTANGSLLTAKIGNVNHNTAWMLKDLEPGLYYWSVQAVDGAFKGSSFSEEHIFRISGYSTTPIVKYSFTYYYGGQFVDSNLPENKDIADWYIGSVYAPRGSFKQGQIIDPNPLNNEVGKNGRYVFWDASEQGVGTWDDLGKVEVISYFNGQNQKAYVPEVQGIGLNGLGSEFGYLRRGVDVSYFGGDYYEASIGAIGIVTATGTVLTDRS